MEATENPQQDQTSQTTEEPPQEQKQFSPEELAAEIKQRLGYEFKNPILLQQAFTHESYNSNEGNYQRLEWMGDAFLNFFMTQDMFFMYPELEPGRLTLLRAANVDNEKLARAAMEHELHRFLRHNNDTLPEQIRTLKKELEVYHSPGLVYAPKALADIVESLIGAVFVDSNRNYDVTWEVVKKLLDPQITPSNFQPNPVTTLHEFCQKRGLTIKVDDDEWPTTGAVEIREQQSREVVGRATYPNKKYTARARASHQAYNTLQVLELAFAVLRSANSEQ